MKNIISFVCLTMLFSCNSDCFSTVKDTGVELSITDNNNIDLLDPQIANSFKEETIDIFYLIEGEPILVNEGHLDYPKGFRIFKHKNEYRIGISLNTAISEDYPITYIKWNEFDTDTIKCTVERNPCNETVRNVWINNVLKWDNYSNERYIKIIK